MQRLDRDGEVFFHEFGVLRLTSNNVSTGFSTREALTDRVDCLAIRIGVPGFFVELECSLRHQDLDETRHFAMTNQISGAK